MSMPDLISFSVYDGIPPQEEGKDPVVYYYWSQKHVSQDAQFNEIGLFLTFKGFCGDFRSSKDCEYFQTETGITCFSDIGADVAISATFDLTKPNTVKSPRVLVASVHRFADVYRACFPTPYRIGLTAVDEQTDSIFNNYLSNFQKVFQYAPFLNRLPPNPDLWTLCEKVFVAAKQTSVYVRTGAFLHNGKVFHSSMNPTDLFAVQVCLDTRPYDAWGLNLNIAQTDELRWLTGPVRSVTGQVIPLFPCMFFEDGPGYPIILGLGNLVVVLIFSEMHAISAEVVEPVKTAIAPFLPDIAVGANLLLNSEPTKTEIYRDDGISVVSKPVELPQSSVLASRERTEAVMDFLDLRGQGFVRFTGQVGQPGNWIFLERQGQRSTAIGLEETGKKPMREIAADSLHMLRDALLG
jgi:hypothetical protein